MSLGDRAGLLRKANQDTKLPTGKVAELLTMSRKSLYTNAKEPSVQEISAKHLIDELHTKHPAWGSRQLSRQLKAVGMEVGRLKTRRYMDEMGTGAIYPKPNLSKAAKQHPIYPYFLRNFTPTRPNQVWSIDITCIRLRRGFIYLTAIIDWYSRMIVGWAFSIAKPEIMNSEQGSQFIGERYINAIKQNRVKISMDGVGRWADNIPIERWFRTLKYEEVYLKNYENIREARKEIGGFIKDYNSLRIHSAINATPAYLYCPMQLYQMLTATPSATLDKPA